MLVVLLPSGSRAWMWSTAAPARHAAMPCSTISSGCSGRFGQSAFVCAPPVSAQVMIGDCCSVAIVGRVDQDEGHARHAVAAVRPGVRRRSLDEDVTGAQAGLVLVEQRPDLPF